MIVVLSLYGSEEIYLILFPTGCFTSYRWLSVKSQLSGYHADTPITIKAEASSKADSRPN